MQRLFFTGLTLPVLLQGESSHLNALRDFFAAWPFRVSAESPSERQPAVSLSCMDIADGGQGVGYVSVQSAHTGYKARLWKIVYIDGVEVSREEINYSSYSMSPRTAVVGVNTANPQRQAEIMAAIGTGSIDHVRGIAAQLYAQEVAEAAAANPAQ